MLKMNRNINQQDLKIVDLHFAKCDTFSLTWSCESGQRDTASNGREFKFTKLDVKGLKKQSD